MIAIAVGVGGIRTAASRAARQVQPLAELVFLEEFPAFVARARGSRCLLIHDFRPDALESVELLRRQWTAGQGFGVLALLAPPASPALATLVTLPRDFPLWGIVVAGEEGAARLAERIRDALARGGRRSLLDAVTSGWRLDPVLARVAECELTGQRPHTTLGGLLREAGIGRKRFVGLTRSRGVSPPLRFLQGLRVMEAAELLQEGCTTRRTAERLGYGSLDTLRRHFRMLAGTTPRDVRTRRMDELVTVVGTGAGLLPTDREITSRRPAAARALRARG
jgi:AraC-like DNA-binding protein